MLDQMFIQLLGLNGEQVLSLKSSYANRRENIFLMCLLSKIFSCTYKYNEEAKKRIDNMVKSD